MARMRSKASIETEIANVEAEMEKVHAKYEALEERLEELLLRSPEVNPLSPIQVTFGNGTATVRGVVPTPSARSAAGSILLADPRVAKVNNLLTFLRPDDETSSLGRLPTVTESNSASAPPMQ